MNRLQVPKSTLELAEHAILFTTTPESEQPARWSWTGNGPTASGSSSSSSNRPCRWSACRSILKTGPRLVCP